MANALTTLPATTVYRAMVQREFWEHRNSFVLLPAALAILLCLLMVVGLLFIDNFDFQIDNTQTSSSTARNKFNFVIRNLSNIML